MSKMMIEAGEHTEDLLKFVVSQTSDEVLDTTEVLRMTSQSGRASEPITTAVVLTLANSSITAISRLIEQWMGEQRQETALRIVSEGFAESSEEGKALLALSRSHIKITVAFGGDLGYD